MKDLKHIRRFNESDENLNISDVSDSEKINNLIQIIEDLYINWEIKTIDVYMKKNKDKIVNIIKSK
jgi:hypothetical protein